MCTAQTTKHNTEYRNSFKRAPSKTKANFWHSNSEILIGGGKSGQYIGLSYTLLKHDCIYYVMMTPYHMLKQRMNIVATMKKK